MTPKIQIILYLAFASICIGFGSNIHGWLSFILLICGVSSAAMALAAQLKSHRNHGITNAAANKWAFLLFAVGFVAVLKYEAEKRPGQKLYPHFKFLAFTDDNFEKTVELTNKFPIPIGPNGFKFMGVLCVPIQLSQSNTFLNLVVSNDSQVLAEDVEIGIAASTNLNGFLSADWKRTRQTFVSDSAPDAMKMESWGILIPAIHPNDGIDCKLSLKVTRYDDWGIIGIMTKAKDSANEVLPFRLMFVTTNEMPLEKPIVISATTNSDGKMMVRISQDQLNELQK
jgi:hypothetical protein